LVEIFSSHLYASTASAKFVSEAISNSNSQKLESITAWVLLYVRRQKKANVYRKSSTKPSYYSVDSYLFKNEKWILQREHKRKYKNLPTPPATAYNHQISSTKIWSRVPFSSMEILVLKDLVQVLSK